MYCCKYKIAERIPIFNLFPGNGVADFRFSKFLQGNVSFENVCLATGNKFQSGEFCCDRVDFKRVDWGDGMYPLMDAS